MALTINARSMVSADPPRPRLHNRGGVCGVLVGALQLELRGAVLDFGQDGGGRGGGFPFGYLWIWSAHVFHAVGERLLDRRWERGSMNDTHNESMTPMV